jgi:hypothetical protein
MADAAAKTTKQKKGFVPARTGLKRGENVPPPAELQVDITTSFPETASEPVGPSLFARAKQQIPLRSVTAFPVKPPTAAPKLNTTARKEKPKNASIFKSLPKQSLTAQVLEADASGVVAGAPIPVLVPKEKSTKIAAPIIQEPPPIVEEKAETTLATEEDSLLPTIVAPVVTAPPTKKSGKIKRPKGNPELTRLKDEIVESVSKSPYTSADEPYVPEDRQSFSVFIKNHFRGFKLPPILDKEIDPNACLTKSNKVEVYAYQKFVREYMRQASPYRGVLVYHGLGSGKTCTSIAAAEALYAQADKKIIVMTPTSLKENFLNELMFCGFRHYRLKNFWVSFPIEDVTTQLFALNVVGLPQSYVESVLKKKDESMRVLWMPDLSKPEDVSNLDELESWQQTSIRDQLYATLNNKIRFIGYTGFTHEKLKDIAMNKKEFFDNAVIIIDEIHNLTRLMCGKLDKYLLESTQVAMKQAKKKDITKKKKLVYEPFGVDVWEPILKSDEDEYERAYLFYRLLAQARNSKIIALSGTPIVNQPVEIGILANILHGYFHGFTDSFSSTNADVIKAVEKYLKQHPRANFYSTRTAEGNTQLFVTILDEGYVKVFDEKNELRGVVYVGVEAAVPATIRELHAEIVDNFSNIDVEFTAKPGVTAKMSTFGSKMANKPVFEAMPLMPPTKQKFSDLFVSEIDYKIKNRNAFVKRMNGLVSYYRGSKESLMPKVVRDEIVNCDMSTLQLPQYQEARLTEIKSEKKKKKSNPLADALNLSEKENTSYRFRSRAVCNFAFPTDLERPFPKNKKELKETTDAIGAILGDTPTDITGNQQEVQNVIDAEKEQLRERDEDYEEDEEGIEQNLSDEEGGGQEGGQPTEKKSGIKRPVIQRPVALGTIQPSTQVPVKPSATTLSYKERLEMALGTLDARKNLIFKMDSSVPKEEQLRYYSPKFSAMIERIEASKGSSLVYSTFKTVEGIGVFGMALEANGYSRIRLTGPETDLSLHPDTIKAFTENPEGKRFIIYSGDDTIRERQTLINIFNGRFDKLPPKISSFLKEMGLAKIKPSLGEGGEEKTELYGNLLGDICRVFMITGAGAEGLSLRNVRTVHIMEPYWNKVRLDQVKGRAIRICSHSDLVYNKDDSLNQRTVEIFTYITVFGPDTKGLLDVTIELNDGNKTSDQYILSLAEIKDTLGRDIQSLLKRGAVDCMLNKQENEKDISCIVYDGPINDFLYDPRLDEDINNQQHVVIQEKTTDDAMEATSISIGKGNAKIDYQMIEVDGRKLIYTMEDDLFENPIYEMVEEGGKQKLKRYKK